MSQDTTTSGDWVSALICSVFITFGLMLLVVIYLLPIWWYYDNYVWLSFDNRVLRWVGFICVLIVYTYLYWYLVVLALTFE